MALVLKDFQEDVCAGVVARFANVRRLYEGLRGVDAAERDRARRRDGAVVLQAPTGAGKTLIAAEVLARLSVDERILWFWFTPFGGLVDQAAAVLSRQAPELRLLDVQQDRSLAAVRGGGVFVTTWASVATRQAASRRARTTGDAGLSLDALIAKAREDGTRIGCVVDEAHHGFHKAKQARRFFVEVIDPDYTLMMTATPRGADAAAFASETGWQIGEPADWAAVSRQDAVAAGLLKRGVRIVRFLARDGDTAQLVNYEQLALRECAATHRQLKAMLADAGIPLTPLMLVQVPNGAEELDAAYRYLVEQLGFPKQAVKVHTAAEPDPDIVALADDPEVEVLLFKMSVALGFDAPRAFTLAALRGARDADFGIQVVGRIVRVHALLQGRDDMPEALNHGYVFLANAASQEGLLEAGEHINALTTRAPELGTQSVVTRFGDRSVVQLARSGEPMSLLLSLDGSRVDQHGSDAEAPSSGGVLPPGTMFEEEADHWREAAQAMLDLPHDDGAARPDDADAGAGRGDAPLVMIRGSLYRYPRRGNAPASLRSERLPSAPGDLEARLADYVDFSAAVLDCRHRSRVQVRRDERGMFDGPAMRESQDDIWASLEPAAVADKAGQIRLRLHDANDRELQRRLLVRFRDAIESSGAEPPVDEEVLLQQLDLVIVRNPQLLAEAYKRSRVAMVEDVVVPLPEMLESDCRLLPAARGLYGVMPAGLNRDEMVIAEQLDGNELVRWWHRNPPRRTESVGLYRWDEGAGFFPDFVVSLEERETPGGIALLEVKGSHLWGEPSEVAKSDATHPEYGQVFMAGRRRGQRGFVYLRRLGQNERLEGNGDFDVARMRW